MTERILIVGGGAVGGVLCAYLGAAHRNVTLLARGDTARLIAKQGIHLTTPEQETIVTRPPVVVSAAEAGIQDIILLATKAFSLPDAMRALTGAIGIHTLVVPVVNGVPWWFGTPAAPIRSVDPQGSLIAAVPPERLVGATIYSPVSRSQSGEWIHAAPGRLTLGPTVPGESSAAAERVVAIFLGTAYRATVTRDIHRAVWSKLVTNASFNTLCALTGTNQQDVARDDRLGKLAQDIMREIEILAQAAGSGIDGPPSKYFEQAFYKGLHKPSTLHDFESGRTVELAAIVDAPLELAARYGLQLPMLSLIGAAVRLKAAGAGLLPSGARSRHLA
ncbi:MAG: 2-dehydropantoate 2-reductase [Betaproteobacteria bacterium]|nr:2-dehydropantoate 2-reductase [Betaproteobacteria bacterium]